MNRTCTVPNGFIVSRIYAELHYHYQAPFPLARIVLLPRNTYAYASINHLRSWSMDEGNRLEAIINIWCFWKSSKLNDLQKGQYRCDQQGVEAER